MDTQRLRSTAASVCCWWSVSFGSQLWIGSVVSPIYLDFEFKKMLPPHTKNLLHHSHRCCTAVCSIYCSGCFQVRVINETFDGQREILRLKSNSEFSDFVDGTVVQPLHTPYSQLWLKKPPLNFNLSPVIPQKPIVLIGQKKFNSLQIRVDLSQGFSQRKRWVFEPLYNIWSPASIKS